MKPHGPAPALSSPQTSDYHMSLGPGHAGSTHDAASTYSLGQVRRVACSVAAALVLGSSRTKTTPRGHAQCTLADCRTPLKARHPEGVRLFGCRSISAWPANVTPRLGGPWPVERTARPPAPLRQIGPGCGRRRAARSGPLCLASVAAVFRRRPKSTNWSGRTTSRPGRE